MNTSNGKQTVSLMVLLILLAGVALAACSPGGAASKETPTIAPNTVTNILWQWVSVTDQSTQKTETVPSPQNYTLILRDDGTFSGTADCNKISGTYKADQGYSFTLGPSTMAACGADSLDQQYIQLLGGVAAGGPDGTGGFALETAGGAQRMAFKNGGPAPAQ